MVFLKCYLVDLTWLWGNSKSKNIWHIYSYYSFYTVASCMCFICSSLFYVEISQSELFVQNHAVTQPFFGPWLLHYILTVYVSYSVNFVLSV